MGRFLSFDICVHLRLLLCIHESVDLLSLLFTSIALSQAVFGDIFRLSTKQLAIVLIPTPSTRGTGGVRGSPTSDASDIVLVTWKDHFCAVPRNVSLVVSVRQSRIHTPSKTHAEPC